MGFHFVFDFLYCLVISKIPLARQMAQSTPQQPPSQQVIKSEGVRVGITLAGVILTTVHSRFQDHRTITPKSGFLSIAVC